MGKYLKQKDFHLDEAEEDDPKEFSIFIKQYNDVKTLRAELIRLGHQPGPIVPSTKLTYLKRLFELKKKESFREFKEQKKPVKTKRICKQEKTFSGELEKSLRTDKWMKNLLPYQELEYEVRFEYDNINNKEGPNGNRKTSFTYLLLDPRSTDNLPSKVGKQSMLQIWNTFVNSIFYIGKGTSSRPYTHLNDAKKRWKDGTACDKQTNKKVLRILDIWDSNLGVICLQIFQNSLPDEALTYEAAMIDAMGLSALTNMIRSSYKGITETWSCTEKLMLGQYLLYKAMKVFLIEGERQLKPCDI